MTILCAAAAGICACLAVMSLVAHIQSFFFEPRFLIQAIIFSGAAAVLWRLT